MESFLLLFGQDNKLGAAGQKRGIDILDNKYKLRYGFVLSKYGNLKSDI